MRSLFKGLLLGCMMALALSGGAAHATITWDDGFEYASDSAMLGVYASSCGANNGVLDVSTTLFHAGAKSIKLVYPSPDSAGGCNLVRDYAATDTLYQRFWMNISSDFQFIPDIPTKVLLNTPANVYPSFWWTVTSHTATGPANLEVGPQGIYVSPGVYTTINVFTSGNVPRGQWACVETRVTMSSPGGADGILQAWINNTQVLNVTNQTMRGTVATPACSGCANNSPTAQLSSMQFYRQHGVGTIYYDDYAVSRDARIGCGSTPPPGDTTPPNPVTGLAVSTAGAATWNATTDNTGGSGLASYTLLRCTGTCTPTVTLVTVGSSTLSYNDLSVVAGTTYSYAIKATDIAGNATAQSATVQMTAAATTRTVLATYTPSGTGADLGATWDAGYTGKNAYKLSSSTIQATVVNTDSMETYNGIATPNDQWAQKTITSLGGTHAEVTCVVLRSANAPTLNAYLVCALKNAGNGLTTLIQNLNGTTNPVLVSESATAWASGDYIRGEIQGTTLKAIRGFASSESVILSVSDTTYSAGKAGLLTYISTGGALTDIQLGVVTIGGFSAPAAPPAIATVTNVSRTQATVTWDLATLPTNIRAWTGNSPVATATAPLSSFPSGVYTYPPTILNGLTDYICFIAQDSGGNEVAGSQKCASVPAAPIDTNPAVVTLSAPTSTLPAGTTSTTLAVTLDKPATCRNDTANPAGTDLAAYNTMANLMTTASLTSSGTISGLSAGTVNYYVRCDFVDVNNVDHPNTTSLTIPVTVAASTADTTKPSTVTGNSCTAISPTQVSCSWNAATDNIAVAGYQISLSYGASNTTYNLVGLPVPATNIITDVLSSTVVNVVVDAVDTSGNLSAAHSNVSTVTTPAVPDTTPPSTMTNLRVVGTFQSSVLLTWDICIDNSGACITIIEQSPAGCAAFSQIKSQLSLTQLIVSLSPGTGYCFRGIFSDGTNLSLAYSNVLQVTTPSTGLGVPRATLPFGVTRDSVMRSSAGTRAVRP